MVLETARYNKNLPRRLFTNPPELVAEESTYNLTYCEILALNSWNKIMHGVMFTISTISMKQSVSSGAATLIAK